MYKNEKGATPVLILIAVIGVIAFLAISNTADFRDKLFSNLFPKPSSHAATTTDVTAYIELLGNPNSARYPNGSNLEYARNPWDMQRIDGKIYIGGGNAANGGPAVNAGPVDLWYYDALSSSFQKDNTTGTNYICGSSCVDSEQIDKFNILNGQIATPDRDPREGWELGNFYRKEATGWVKYRTIPAAVHVFDLRIFQNKLYAALGPNYGTSDIVVSADNGLTWSNINNSYGITRMYSLFELGGLLYGSSDDGGADSNGQPLPCINRMLSYTGSGNLTQLSSTKVNAFFPGSSAACKRVARPTYYNNQLVYVGASTTSDGSQIMPFGLYVASSESSVRQVTLPGGGLPWDVITGEDGVLYVLGAIQVDATHFIVTVNKTADLANWSEVFRINTDTFARSFEMLNGDFYLGLGSNTSYIPASTGNILRVKSSVLNLPPSPAPTSTPAIAPPPPASPTPLPTPTPSTVDTTIPTVTITSPLYGATVSGNVNFNVTMTDNAPISSTAWYIDHVWQGSLNSLGGGNFSAVIDTTKLANGSHLIEAQGYDPTGNKGQGQVTVTVSNQVATPVPVPTPTPVPTNATSVEGETMSLVANSNILQVLADSLASGGKFMKFWGNVTSNVSFNNQDTTSQIVVRASGDQCSGAPNMVVRVDGVIVYSGSVTSSSWANYTVNKAISAGLHNVSVEFNNDYTNTVGRNKVKCDRNLKLDKISFQ